MAKFKVGDPVRVLEDPPSFVNPYLLGRLAVVRVEPRGSGSPAVFGAVSRNTEPVYGIRLVGALGPDEDREHDILEGCLRSV